MKNLNFIIFFCSKRLNTIHRFGRTGENTASLKGSLAWMTKRPSYQPTGTHPSPRSVSVWRLVRSPSSLFWTKRQARCTPWLQMANIAKPLWVGTNGRSWSLVLPYKTTAKRRVSTSWVLTPVFLGHELESWVTMKTLARPVIPESGLVPLDTQTIPTRVVTWPSTVEIMATNSSKPWDTSSFSRNS